MLNAVILLGFDGIVFKELVLINIMLTGCIRRSGTPFPARVTFVSLSSTFSHFGMAKDGGDVITMMRDKYRTNPILEHYTCMVKLCGRVGLISEAYDIKNRVKFEPGPTVRGALLYACYLHGNVDVDCGEIAALQVFLSWNQTMSTISSF
ncbi:hypothetical protein POM88_053315 [Heracleum sosnowskyi]|uniref:Pentatricopeptide repeat-containing protein n=1 Tax=Heracleum sosnowskyi TaxID=360622 RepID=A0AAD8GQR0_9APIA|nr:hypothetical protein POM88_053315 [Heracleum sosnowskyi]